MTDKWGPAWWGFLHSLAESYPCRPCAAERRAARHVVEALVVLLPCPRCRRHFGELLRRRPVDVRGRVELAEWMWSAHNEVNARLGKPRVPREEALAGLEECDAAAARRDGGDGAAAARVRQFGLLVVVVAVLLVAALGARR